MKNWDVDSTIEQPKSSKTAIMWFNSQLNKSIKSINEDFEAYRISEAMMTIYKLFWDEFSGWYLEMIKPEYQKPIDKTTYDETIKLFDKLLKLIHPFMPFITEEIWHYTAERSEGESIMTTMMPAEDEIDEDMLEQFVHLKDMITNIRNIRKSRNIANKEPLELMFISNNIINNFEVVTKIANIEKIEQVEEKPQNSASFIVKTSEFFVPLGSNINVEEEIEKLTTELNYLKGFLKSVMGKLNNERFVGSAPAKVVELEKDKKADAESKIEIIEQQLSELKK